MGLLKDNYQGMIQYEYMGRKRDLQIVILRFKKSGSFTYVAFFENRFITTLQDMLNSSSLQKSFTEEECNLQYKIFNANLDFLLKQNEDCKNLFKLLDLEINDDNTDQEVFENFFQTIQNNID